MPGPRAPLPARLALGTLLGLASTACTPPAGGTTPAADDPARVEPAAATHAPIGAGTDASAGGAASASCTEALGDEPARPALGPLAPEAAHDDGGERALLADEPEAVPPRFLPGGAAFELDRDARGAVLLGRPEPALADADPERVVILSAAASPGAGLEGLRVLDARFVAGGVVTLGADHVLRIHRAGSVTELDTMAEPPLSVSASGTVVAYARGEMPGFELARADLLAGDAAALTEGMAPVWSPAVSPDGREIVFVSGATGAPRLYRLGAGDAAPTLLPDAGVFPSSPRAPRWIAGVAGAREALVFEDEAGARFTLDLATGALVP